ncbi:MAG: DNA repair protein RadC [Casimicrobiaceae bacterium]|nr:DNA repair protein RadC [Casimicrobiaceae bacterium]MCX8098497.1 DNA repair protein RadC [Casimicrobiaceae bacterium]MDW8311600.1 DNA repair protein RadC [Burkholderiales bacterium]
MSIRHWPIDERPREKLLEHGASVLSDAELLAIFLRVGTRGQNAVELARSLLDRFGSLAGVVAADRKTFLAVPGLGEAKYVQLQAALELARRTLETTLTERPLMHSPEAVSDYLRLVLGFESVEVFVALWLDSQHRLIAMDELARGTLAQASVFPREVVKQALARNAASVVFAHNHPSGVTQPSAADRSLTLRLKEALALVDVRVLDHCIVGGAGASGIHERPIHSMAAYGEL